MQQESIFISCQMNRLKWMHLSDVIGKRKPYVPAGWALQGQLGQCLALSTVLMSDLGFLKSMNTQNAYL